MMASLYSHSLTKEEIARFSRQLILKDFGPSGQERLRNTKVLIIGAGGLGCPVSMYLVAAGIGRLSIVDHDVVSIDNLHRQTLHDEQRVGRSKTDSLKESLLRINSKADVIAHDVLLTSQNALQLFHECDIVADCSDNVATRYLINDACVLAGKPLVYGSALGWEGQLIVYNNGPKCPCYRCIYPEPPNPEMVSSCSEGGILGPVVGVIGSLQALEIIKIAVTGKSSFTGKMWLFDGLDGITKTINMRDKMSTCAICSENPKITALQDYQKFCGSGPTDKIRCLDLIPENGRISPKEYAKLRNKRTILLDVRSPAEFEICHLPEAKNFPWDELRRANVETIMEKLNAEKEILQKNGRINGEGAQSSREIKVFVVCHRGNDSQLAVRYLTERLATAGFLHCFNVRHIVGGLHEWAMMDNTFPCY